MKLLYPYVWYWYYLQQEKGEEYGGFKRVFKKNNNILSGRTYEEAARMLGISVEEVKQAEAAMKAIEK